MRLITGRLATVDCHAIRSNFLLWSENVLGGIIKENKGDRCVGRENTHCAGSIISREIENDSHSHLHLQERLSLSDVRMVISHE